MPGNAYQARFICNVPRSACGQSGAAAALRPRAVRRRRRGRRDNVEQLGNANNVIVCGTDFIGMSAEDVPNALAL